MKVAAIRIYSNVRKYALKSIGDSSSIVYQFNVLVFKQLAFLKAAGMPYQELSSYLM